MRPVQGGTRLVTRSRSRAGPPLFARLFGFLVGEPVHFAMQTRQLRNLRARIEAPAVPTVDHVERRDRRP